MNWNWNSKVNFSYTLETKLELHSRNKKNQIYPPDCYWETDITENQPSSTHIRNNHNSEVSSWYSDPNLELQSGNRKSKVAPRRPFWKPRHWKSICFCPWPQTTCTKNFKLKFQSKLELRCGNHSIYRQTERQTQTSRRTESSITPHPHTSTPHPPPPTKNNHVNHTFYILILYFADLIFLFG